MLELEFSKELELQVIEIMPKLKDFVYQVASELFGSFDFSQLLARLKDISNQLPNGYHVTFFSHNLPQDTQLLDFAINEFRDMKMQPSLERALKHEEILGA